MTEGGNMESKPTNSEAVTAGLMEVQEELTEGLETYLGIGHDIANRREYLLFMAAGILVSLGIVALLVNTYMWAYLQPYYAFISDKEQISAFFRSTGAWAPLVYILLEAGQCVTIFWPVPLEVVGGFLFGLPLGVVYSMIGLTLGAVLAFLLARAVLLRYVCRFVEPQKFERFRQLMTREGALAAFIIYLIPAVPKDFVSYILGLTKLSLKFFVVAVMLFRLPPTFLLVLQGAEAAQGHYWVTVGLIGFNYFLAFLIYRYREYVYNWIKAWHIEEL
jgi:uncharacterized membrane protein YdjX (TVP38/TMEM64 family)